MEYVNATFLTLNCVEYEIYGMLVKVRSYADNDWLLLDGDLIPESWI